LNFTVTTFGGSEEVKDHEGDVIMGEGDKAEPYIESMVKLETEMIIRERAL
jgi:hypothetical protein